MDDGTSRRQGVEFLQVLKLSERRNNYMEFHPKRTLRKLLSKPTSYVASLWPSPLTIGWLRSANRILLDEQELLYISKVIKARRPCKFLIFGLGYDSLYWAKLNKHGVTVFLEESQEWLNLVRTQAPNIDANFVDYRTSISQWKELLHTQELYKLELPDHVMRTKWDVILVDGPEGWRDSSPGRMQSIAMASRLIAPSVDVFVHDCNREIEATYTSEYLGNENLITEVGILRHYHLE